MDDEFKLAAEKIVAEQLRKTFGRGSRPRSTYTQSNVDQFLPYIDKFIEEMKDVCVPYIEFYQISPMTLYKKLCDAFKYLCDNSDETKYKIARSRCKMQLSSEASEGVWIRLINRSVQPRNVSMPSTVSSSDWKDLLITWLGEGTNQMFYIENLNLSLDDKEMVEHLLSEANNSLEGSSKMSWKITFNMIRIMR